MRFSGALSDGRSAGARPVEVSLGDGGLELRAADGLPARLWPYELLRSSVPLRAKATDVLLSLQPDGSQTLFVADPAFAGQLLGRAPALSAARQRWRGLRPGLAAVSAVLAIAWAYGSSSCTRPRPWRGTCRSSRARCSGGTSSPRSPRTTRPARRRPAAPRSTGSPSASPRRHPSSPMPVRVMLLDWRLVNAFAVPGGQIILTRGLVQTAGSPDEVAGVLAHELGHALELHPETGLVRAMGLTAATQLIFAGSAGTVSNVGLRADAAALHAHCRARGRCARLAHAQGRRHLAQGLRRLLRAPRGQAAGHGGGQEHRRPGADPHPSANRRAHRHGARPAGLSGDAGALRRGLAGAARRLRAGVSAPAGRGRRRRPRDRRRDEDAREQSQRCGGPAEARARLHQEAPARAGARRLHQGHPVEAERCDAALPSRPGAPQLAPPRGRPARLRRGDPAGAQSRGRPQWTRPTPTAP